MAIYEVYYPKQDKPEDNQPQPNILENQKNDLLEILRKKGPKDAVLATNYFN